MSFSRFPFRAIKPLSVLTVALAATAVGGCGNDRDVAQRPERGVVAKVYALQTRTDGQLVFSGTTSWKRPGATLTEVEPNGQPQVDITACDYDYDANRVNEGTDDDRLDYVRGSDIDSLCFAPGGDDNELNDCGITTGLTRYTSMLGAFDVTLINNSITKTQNMAINGIGINVRIENAAGAEVWNMQNDNLDYQDLVSEAGNLLAADRGDECVGKIIASVDTRSMRGVRFFGTPGAPYTFALSPANADDFTYRVYWNGKDSNGNDVPAGSYSAHFDITVIDTDTDEQWEAPAAVEFTIADADPT